MIDPAKMTVIRNVQTGANALDVAFDRAGTAYVTNFGSGSVSVIDTVGESVIATIGVGDFPREVAVSPDGTRTYASNVGMNSVTVISLASSTTAP